ncbi:MAG TPA: nuclear transport factor 2 family protein [Bryobacteraceae bacterium]|nr:nuclear transport factor 2 family protein [Bryobacteraceae bacterium]
MKHLIGALVTLAFLLGATTRAFPQDRKKGGSTDLREKNIQTILDIFRMIEDRDPQKPNPQRQLELVNTNVEFHWPASLPYGGSSRGIAPLPDRPSWGAVWTPLQPTRAERRMDPRVVAANDDEVVVLYHQRGLSAAGDRYDGEVLGLYQLREGKLARAQMFYFDEAGATEFLARAKSQLSRSK